MKLFTKIIQIMKSILFCHHHTPRFLYQYRRLSGANDFLVNHCLRLENPLKYNDPYEGKVRIEGTNNNEKKYRALKETVEPQLGQFGLSCFTSICNNILMWAYYAEEQKGICFEFDTSKDPLTFDKVFQISYREQLPIHNVEDRTVNAYEILTTKSSVWQHEHEYRIIKKGKAEQYITINPEAITSVILGCNAAHFHNDDDYNANILRCIFENLKRPEYEHIKIKQVKLEMDQYRIIVKEVPFFVSQRGGMVEIISFKDQLLCVQTFQENSGLIYNANVRKWEKTLLNLNHGRYCILNGIDDAIEFEYR